MNFSSSSILTLLVLAISTVVEADVAIFLHNISDPAVPFKQYEIYEFFTTRYANTYSPMIGFLHQPDEAKDGCSYIPPVPFNDTVQWFAVIENYPSCVDEMINNVRSAGYGLIVAYSSGNANNSLPNHVRNDGFPIVVISEDYGTYLVDGALSDLDNPQVQAQVETGMTMFLVVSLVLFGCVVLPVFCFCCVCCMCCYTRGRRRRDERASLEHVRRRRNLDRIQNRDHVARQELIESILRQLQQLQLDAQSQRPLGDEPTRRLPTKRYSKLSESQELCAICVDDFKEGDLQRVLPCNHCFHIQCIDEWLINHSDLCPLCKMQVPRGTPEGQGGAQGRGGGRGTGARGNLHDMILFTDDETTSDSSQERLISNSSTEARYGSI